MTEEALKFYLLILIINIQKINSCETILLKCEAAYKNQLELFSINLSIFQLQKCDIKKRSDNRVLCNDHT